jgi:hypothetical protein
MSVLLARAPTVEAGVGEVDFDVHGLAGVRLRNASPRDVGVVGRQLGPLRTTLDQEPDIVIHFVDRLEAASPGRYLGLGEAAFTDDAFVVLRSKHKAPAKVRVDLSRIGEQIEIVCERGLPAVPLLVPILNLTLLAKGVIPLHASAFVHEGTGIVVTGWSKSGKTEALLAFGSRGAEYVGDEWIYLAPDGSRVYGIPQPIRIWDWHLRQLPQYQALIARGDRARLRALELLLPPGRVLQRIGHGRHAPARAFRRLEPLVRSQLHVDVEPERLFGPLGELSTAFDRLFFLVSRDTPGVDVAPIDPLEVAERMVFSLQHERLDFMAYYLKSRFAFPDAASPVVERAEELQREALLQALSGKRAYVVHHPYPFSFAALYEAMRRFC